MNTYTITFLPDHKTIEIEAGATLLEAQRRAGYIPDAPCGGRGKCGKCTVEIVEGAVPGRQKSCTFYIKSDLTVRLPDLTAKNQILAEGRSRTVDADPWLPEELKETSNVYLAAVDLGTTTIAAYLLDAKSGHNIAVSLCLNPQAPYGADVINRCEYALNGGADVLAECVHQSIDQLIQEMVQETGISRDQIAGISLAGNSCMQHLFLRWPVNSLTAAPYLPHSKESVCGLASEYGIHIHSEGKIWVLPVIESFVGADTLACIMSAGLEKREKLTLMIDIGTNGELVLAKGGRLLTCSTAAGPALEGAKISCGMRGGTGAIDHVTLDENKNLAYSVIGGGEPKGICGSGLLDLTACLLKLGIIDESGFMEEDYKISDRVSLTKRDVREVQLAKAAIAAGINIMCDIWEINLEDIEDVLIAGAFGNYMNPASACAIGLLPREFLNKVSLIGNAAGEGAKLAVLNKQEFERSCQLASGVEFLELANRPEFQDTFVDELSFAQEV